MTRLETGRPRKPKANPLRTRKIDSVDWKDTNLLRLFISDRGKIRPRRVTGLTPRQQREVATAVRNAREMALLPYPNGRAPSGRVPGAGATGPSSDRKG